MSIEADVSKVFGEPSLWRMEAAEALRLEGDDLIAAMSPGPAFPAALRSLEVALMASPKVIIELGAGTGGVSEWIRVSTGATVYAVEPEDGARQAAERAFPHVHVIEGRAHSTSLPGGSADAVVMSGVTSLMIDLAPEIAEVDRLLTASGRFAIADLFSGSRATWYSAPNVFRSVEDLGRALHRHGFTVTDLGLGEAVPDPSWAAVAQAVDDWIDTYCTERPGYEDWKADREHLRHHIQAGHLIGGCIVAHRTALDHVCATCEWCREI